MKSKRSLYFLLAALCFVAALVWLSIPSHAKTSGNYQYEFQEDGTVEITKYTGKETDVKIPATIEGKKVTKIGGNVYGDEKIYTGAFHSLINVNSIVIPDGVKIIGKCAFYSCYAKSITIPNSVVKIEEQAFSMTGLKNVIIPNSVTDIGEEAFAGCYSLESIHIPASVKKIGLKAFCRNEMLQKITVDSNNKFFTSVNGVLFNKDKTTLITYPAGKPDIKYQVPFGVKRVEGYAFQSSKLQELFIPISVINLGYEINCDCYDLKSITILNKNCVFENYGLEVGSYIIYGYKNSTAEKYAKKYNRTFKEFNPNTCKHENQLDTTEATTKKNGSKIKKCKLCGSVVSESVIYYPKTVSLSTSSYTYNGKAKKPSVTVKDSKGKKVSSSNYSVTYSSGRKSVGKYTVTIKFKGNYSGTVKKTFTIKPKVAAISSVKAAKKGFTVKWKKQATQTTGYQIRYSTKSNMKSAKTATINKTKTVSKKVSGLRAKTKYYVQVRTYKTVKVSGKSTKIYSDWSKKKSITTKK